MDLGLAGVIFALCSTYMCSDNDLFWLFGATLVSKIVKRLSDNEAKGFVSVNGGTVFCCSGFYVISHNLPHFYDVF